MGCSSTRHLGVHQRLDVYFGAWMVVVRNIDELSVNGRLLWRVLILFDHPAILEEFEYQKGNDDDNTADDKHCIATSLGV
jgi:hypothetical protein